MIKRDKSFFWILAALLVVALGCNFPFGLMTTPEPLSYADRTLTALFGSGLFGTLTAPPIAPTNTPTDNINSPTPISSPTPVTVDTPVPTSADSPTHTLVPTVAITTVPLRSAVAYADYRGAPIMDGVWDEWTSTIFPANYIIFGWAAWTGEKDLQASYRVGWDEKNLYLAVKVIDDRYVQNASGGEIYKGDSVEILLDTDLYGDFSSAVLDTDDYQLLLSPGNPDTNGVHEGYLYFPSSVRGTLPQVQIASNGGDGLYRVEVIIPWSVVGVLPARGNVYGFALRVSDNDNPAENIQQSMSASLVGNSLLDPTTWMQLILR